MNGFSTPKKTTRFDQRKRRTRQQLRDAAVALILERGYDAISIQDITDRADVGRGTFYLHFKDKQEIVAAAIQDAYEHMAVGTAELLAQLPLDQRDYLSFVAFFKYLVGQGSLFRAILLSKDAAGVAEYIADYTLKQAYSRLAEQNIFPDVPGEIAAEFMTGALMRVVRWWTQSGEKYSAEQMGDLFYRLLLRQAPPVG